MGELGTFMVILAIGFLIMLWEEAPWLLITIAVGIIALVVYCLKNPSSSAGGGYHSPSGVSYSPPSSDSSTPSSNGADVETFLYKGRTTTWEPVLATCRDGRIFDGYNSGLNMSFIRASYDDGWVYDKALTGVAGTVLGRYDDEGRIYTGRFTSYDKQVGFCKDGFIYRGTSSFGEIIGCYEGDKDAAAAASLIYLFN